MSNSDRICSISSHEILGNSTAMESDTLGFAIQLEKLRRHVEIVILGKPSFDPAGTFNEVRTPATEPSTDS